MDLQQMGRDAKEASFVLSKLSTYKKNQALNIIANALEQSKDKILTANVLDLENAKLKGIGSAMLDRLTLTESRLQGIIDDMRKVISLDDPVGSEFDSKVLPNGLKLLKRRVPLGVVGVIYEARPNVTVDITSLCLKTGNASILRGGKETINSNIALIEAIQKGLLEAQLPKAAVQYITEPNREYVTELLHLDKYVDMIIPRGGKSLHELCRKESTIPVIIGGFGIGHIFVDESADLERALDVIENSKVQRPSACNAVDTILVHKNISLKFLPMLAERMQSKNVKLVAHGDAFEILSKLNVLGLTKGVKENFDTEWLSLCMNVSVVNDFDSVINHMLNHGACHSDAILTNNHHNACRFVNEAPSACAYINASTRFSDGGQFGLGAEVAISTQKLHARGPMGLEELTSYKWIAEGDYLSRK
ncbi:MAG: glutamate-5-semialdehyde dehydrogenase [Succinivibrionaceae bacterium]